MALGDRRQVLEAFQALELEAPLPVVEARPVDPAAPAGLAHIPQPLGELQDFGRRCASFSTGSFDVSLRALCVIAVPPHLPKGVMSKRYRLDDQAAFRLGRRGP